ncbi:chromosome partitioning protein ParA [Vibrio sagamiensis]|uniref:Chromosome partitioning protein ParA n=1 Tax=Vibrio sagamiensis NBRC 104589 TaxID=1219064 RepID=A0A511QB51_9VIBR|nr:chromosome partitioning protein ParA [Vibrio sagamiensis]PNQ59583.1 chromosome partitioning protein ParA [Vibrio agarivorans]GEM74539.1 hypothetical protein VSA01S_06510 [Vibrio sagamiensis NBRC 104589]
MTSQQNIDDQDDDVVVIEERDKRTPIYIAIGVILGVALGGVLGATLTSNQWESTYQALDEKYQALESTKVALLSQVKEREAGLDKEVDSKVMVVLNKKQQEFESNLQELELKMTELGKVNDSLKAQIEQQNEKLNLSKNENLKLNRQADRQATIFERSREVFRKELKVSQELEAFEKERETLLPKIEKLRKECDVFLEGTSWDIKADVCDKHDEANSRLSQLDQLIEVNKLDLEHIKAITDDMGL